MDWAQVLTKVLELLDIKRILASFLFGLVTRLIVPDDFPLNTLLASKTEGTWVWLLIVYSVVWYVLFLFFGWLIKKYNENKKIQKEAIELQEKVMKEAQEFQEKLAREEKEHIAKYELLPNGCAKMLKSFILNNNESISLKYSDDRYYILSETKWIIEIPCGSVNDGDIHADIMLKPEIYADIKKLCDAGKLFTDIKDTK